MKSNTMQEMCKKFGHEYYGPFLLGFVKWLDDTLLSDDITNAFFLSRDGYMMLSAYKAIKGSCLSKYVYFSRQSIRNALLYKETNYESSLRYLTQERYISLGKLMRYYGFDEHECQKLAFECGLSLETEYRYIELAKKRELKKFYEQNREKINCRSKKQAILLKAYLKQIHFIGKCAIVDIGWHGSMQFYLEKFCENEGIDTLIYGYYIGINPIEKLRGQVSGYLFSPANTLLRKEVLCFLGGYEKLFQSCEGSTIGYKFCGIEVKPVCLQYEYSLKGTQVKIINIWQKYALKYVCDNCNLVIGKWQNIAKKLIEFGKNPPVWGIKMFRDFYLTDGCKQYFVSQKGLIRYNPKELIHAISNSIWKTGFLKSIFYIPLPYYRIYCLLKK